MHVVVNPTKFGFVGIVYFHLIEMPKLGKKHMNGLVVRLREQNILL